MYDFRTWDKELSNEETTDFSSELASIYIGRITDSQTRAALSKAVSGRDYRSLCNWSVDYTGGISAADVINVRACLGLFQKLETLDLGSDKESVARNAFIQSEHKCRETNELFRKQRDCSEARFHNMPSDGDFSSLPGVDSVLHAAQRKIAEVLGPLPSFSQLDLSFGPGATSTVPKINACSRIKLSTVPSCSTNMLPILPALLREVPHWSALHNTGVHIDDEGWLVETTAVEISHGRLSFVPKNAKTYRSVLTEPTLNAVLQAGFGRWIGDRLLSVGQNIHDQSRNQRLAREGSLTGALATLDLSSASDSIATELVAHLLPYDWYVALTECRTPSYTDMQDEPRKLAKFSSMGNGFTFPLQTLIFWALVKSCQAHDSALVSVYGDDIICPSTSVSKIKRVFDAVGFTLNMDKSYWEGSFRESCGADYYLGIDVRPFYLKRNYSCRTLFIMHNRAKREYDDEVAAWILGFIPKDLRLFGPDGYGDGHLLGDWAPRMHKREDGWSGHLFDTFVAKGRKHTRLLPGDRVLPCYTIMLSAEVRYGTHASAFHYASLPKQRHRKTGVVFDTLPGVSGYKRISIYTFTAP